MSDYTKADLITLCKADTLGAKAEMGRRILVLLDALEESEHHVTSLRSELRERAEALDAMIEHYGISEAHYSRMTEDYGKAWAWDGDRPVWTTTLEVDGE